MSRIALAAAIALALGLQPAMAQAPGKGVDKAQLWINHDKARRDSLKLAPEFHE